MTNDDDLISLIRQIVLYVTSTPQSEGRERTLSAIREIEVSMPVRLEGLTPEYISQLVLLNPQLVRSGLELVLTRDEGKFLEGVPQVFDTQTGLPLKLYFENVLLPRAIKKAEQEGLPVSYLLMDLDKFHDFNNSYGRLKGDEVISRFSELMKKGFRTSNRRGMIRTPQVTYNKRTFGDRREVQYNDVLDGIARLPDEYTSRGRVGGGEEFGVILYGLDENGTLVVANRFLDDVRKIRIPYESGQSLSITVSGGVAQYHHDMSQGQLMQNAEAALKYAKSKGRNRVEIFSNTQKN